jgi:serine/threonine protein kinase
MSPESIGQHIYSKQSDVWTFGIVGTFYFLLFLSFCLQHAEVILIFILNVDI